MGCQTMLHEHAQMCSMNISTTKCSLEKKKTSLRKHMLEWYKPCPPLLQFHTTYQPHKKIERNPVPKIKIFVKFKHSQGPLLVNTF